MKKTVSLLLALVMIFSCAGAVFCSAANGGVSLSQGKDALVAQWEKGSSNGFDYRAFSPVKSSIDNTKYPLVVLFHGKYSGTKEGEQLTSSEFYNWSSKEYQSRFEGTGGAFILMPRTGSDNDTWAKDGNHSDLKKLIDNYISAHADNIDTDRIYLGGWSMGGAGVISMASKYENFFAALIVMAPFDSVSQSQVDSIKNTPVWLVTCTQDTTASYVTFAKPFWNKLRDTTKIPSYCRVTTFSKYNYYDAGHHYVHHAVAQDMLNQPSNCGMHTENAKGETVNINGTSTMITWLSSQHLAKNFEDDYCHCDCHSQKGWTSFIWAIKVFFWRIFSSDKKMCDCGAAHW